MGFFLFFFTSCCWLSFHAPILPTFPSADAKPKLSRSASENAIETLVAKPTRPHTDTRVRLVTGGKHPPTHTEKTEEW